MIVIDPGHGGRDIGARAKDPYCEEKKITLTTSRLIKKYLTQLGYRVAMTRDSDADISLAQRVEIAAQADADLFVSVHFNSTRNQTVKGIEVFFSESSPASGGASPSRVPSSRRFLCRCNPPTPHFAHGHYFSGCKERQFLRNSGNDHARCPGRRGVYLQPGRKRATAYARVSGQDCPWDC